MVSIQGVWDLHDKKQNINGNIYLNVCFCFVFVCYLHICALVVCISLTTMYRPYWKNGYKTKLWT